MLKNKAEIVLGLATLLCAATVAAEDIQGSVQSSAGNAITSAQISVIETGKKNPEIVGVAESDAEGSFTVQDLPAGSYTVTITARGYQKFHQKDIKVSLESPAKINATLQPGP